MTTKTESKTVYVLKVLTPGETGWLRETGGDWGPKWMPTDNIHKAVQYDSRVMAEFVMRNDIGGWEVKIEAVKLKTEIVY